MIIQCRGEPNFETRSGTQSSKVAISPPDSCYRICVYFKEKTGAFLVSTPKA